MAKRSERSGARKVLEYQYDADGNMAGLTDAAGRHTEYRYDKIGRIEEVLQGRDSVAKYSYGEGNRIASILYGSGVNVQYGYDGDGHMTSLRATSQEGQDLMRHTYSYDNNGNQIAKMEQHQLTLYGYDRLNRLLEVDYGSGAQESFSYDRAGNRIRRVLDGRATSYTYDSRNRLLSFLEEDSRQTEFEYDRQGNMVSERSGSGTTTYSYDAFNRTAKVEKPDGSHIHHFYDPEGLRSGLRENGVTSRFVYDGWNMVNELDGEHNVKASYVRGHEWLAQVDGRGDSYYYLNNQHGDVAHITNRLGGIVNSYEYDAFGRTLSATEGIPNRFRYAGEQFDHTTEQYYLRARFYNPVIARFTQEDEYRGDGLNLYAYVGNNPINYVDPSGYMCEEKGNVYAKGGKNEGDLDTIRGYRGRDLTNYPKEYLIDPRLLVEMNYKGKGASGTNSAGWERNSKKFFKELLKRNPEFWSEENATEIRRGRAPVVDEHFIQHFPQYKNYLEDPFRHHHIGEGGQAAALPLTLHPGYGGVHNIEKEWGITGVDDTIASRLNTILRR